MKDDTTLQPGVKQAFRRLAVSMKWIMRIVGPAMFVIGYFAESFVVADSDSVLVVTCYMIGLGWTVLGWFGQWFNRKNSEKVYFQTMIAMGLIWIGASYMFGLAAFMVVTLLS